MHSAEVADGNKKFIHYSISLGDINKEENINIHNILENYVSKMKVSYVHSY